MNRVGCQRNPFLDPICLKCHNIKSWGGKEKNSRFPGVISELGDSFICYCCQKIFYITYCTVITVVRNQNYTPLLYCDNSSKKSELQYTPLLYCDNSSKKSELQYTPLLYCDNSSKKSELYPTIVL